MASEDSQSPSCLPKTALTSISKEDWRKALESCELRRGETLFAQVLPGLPRESLNSLLETLLELLGPEGSLLIPAYNSLQNRMDPRPLVVDQHTSTVKYHPLADLARKRKDRVVIRSEHPSHSFVAMGRAADSLLEGHGPLTRAMLPVERLIASNGKMLLIEPVAAINPSSPTSLNLAGDSSPIARWFPTLHVAQAQLGLTRRHLKRLLEHAWIREGDSVAKWWPREHLGCSPYLETLASAHRQLGNLQEGRVVASGANASAGEGTPLAKTYLLCSSALAFKTELELLRARPTIVDCQRPECLSCGLRTYQPWRIPQAVFRNVFKKSA